MDHGRVTSVAELLQKPVESDAPQDETTSLTNTAGESTLGSPPSHSTITAEAISTIQPVKRKRRRIPMSCNVCRYRKLKCDRQQPCGSCTTLKMASICQYETRVPTNVPYDGNDNQDESSCGTNPDSDHFLRTRIACLEKELSEIRKGDCQRYHEQQQLDTVMEESMNNVLSASVSQVNHKFLQYTPSYFVNAAHRNMPILHDYEETVSNKVKEAIGQSASSLSHEENSSEKILVPMLQNLKTNVSHAKWKSLLDILPSRRTHDDLKAAFLSLVNSVFHALDPTTLDELFSHAEHLTEQKDQHTLTLSAHDVHVVCLVLVICAMAGLSDSRTAFPHTTSDLFAIAFEAVRQTDIITESSLESIQLIYYLCIYYNVFISSPDCSMLTNILVQSAYAVGLHRDPEAVTLHGETICKHTWRRMWRQVVFIDTLQSLDTGLPPLINMKFSDCNMECFPTINWCGINSERAFTRWSLLCRDILENVLLAPLGSISQSVLDQVEHNLSSFSIETSNEKSDHTLQIIIKLLMGDLNLKYSQTIKGQDKFKHIASAFDVLQIQHQYCMDSKDLKHETITNSFGIKYCMHAWSSIVRSLLDDEVLSRGAGEGRRFLDLLKSALMSYEWTCSIIMSFTPLSTFESWKKYLVGMEAMLLALKEKLPDCKKNKVAFRRIEDPISRR